MTGVLSLLLLALVGTQGLATSALDPASQGEILALFSKLNRELHMAILYVSHDLASVAKLCHTVGILQAGRLIRCGPAAEMLAGALSPVIHAGDITRVAEAPSSISPVSC